MPLARRLLDSGTLDQIIDRFFESVGVAALDQRRPEAAESRGLIDRMSRARALPVRLGGWSPAALAWAMAVGAAVEARVRFTCLHAVHFSGTVPAVTSLTHGARICRRCLERGEAWPAMLDDGVCDVCDHHATEFREVTTALGADIVTASICPACTRFSVRAADRRAAA